MTIEFCGFTGRLMTEQEAQMLLQPEVRYPYRHSNINKFDIMRLESMASCMLTPLWLVALGTRRKDSNPSNTERRLFSLPPSLNAGRALSNVFFMKFIVFCFIYRCYSYYSYYRNYFLILLCGADPVPGVQCAAVPAWRSRQTQLRQSPREQPRRCPVPPCGQGRQ